MAQDTSAGPDWARWLDSMEGVPEWVPVRKPPTGGHPRVARVFERVGELAPGVVLALGLGVAGERLASWFGGAETERSHRGRGPKNYVRTDARIAEDVNEALTEDPYIDASDISVAVANGEVTLSGRTATREERRRAEDHAERALGVRHVRNDIRVQPAEGDDEPLPVPMV